MPSTRSLIINAPWYYPKAHQTLLTFLNHPNYHGLFAKAIFMGSAAPVATLSPSSTLHSYLAQNSQLAPAFSSEIYIDSLAILDKCAVGYRAWAQEQGVCLLVCGMAAKRFLQDQQARECDGLALTGYMEVLALLNGPQEEVVLW